MRRVFDSTLVVRGRSRCSCDGACVIIRGDSAQDFALLIINRREVGDERRSIVEENGGRAILSGLKERRGGRRVSRRRPFALCGCRRRSTAATGIGQFPNSLANVFISEQIGLPFGFTATILVESQGCPALGRLS